MKNVINYFYNLNIDNLRMIDDDYYFIYQNSKYILQEIKENKFDYQAIFELNKILKMNNKAYFNIIMNRNNQIITYYSNKKYILMIDNSLLDRMFDFYDVIDSNVTINIDNKIINNLNRSNWSDLWKNKIDYFEMYINHNINKYLILNKYVNYFIGLAENAITYTLGTLDEVSPNVYDRLVVSHKRINFNNSIKQLYNPLSLVVDHPSRDICEYLKMSFWNNIYTKEIIENYLNSLPLSNYGARLIIARMLFPSFFFDAFERLINEKMIEKDILYIIDRINEYEEYVLTIYLYLKKRYSLPEIKWLKKVDYSSTLTTPNTSGTSFINIDSIPSLSVTSIMLQ